MHCQAQSDEQINVQAGPINEHCGADSVRVEDPLLCYCYCRHDQCCGAYLFPTTLCTRTSSCSSSAVHASFLMPGCRWCIHRSRHCKHKESGHKCWTRVSPRTGTVEKEGGAATDTENICQLLLNLYRTGILPFQACPKVCKLMPQLCD